MIGVYDCLRLYRCAEFISTIELYRKFQNAAKILACSSKTRFAYVKMRAT